MDGVEITAEMTVLIAVVAAILQVAKATPIASHIKPWLPYIGIGLGIILSRMPPEWLNYVIPGAIIGLTASGAYSTFKGKNKGAKR